MNRGQTVILRGQSQRDFAKQMIDRAPADAVVNIAAAARTNDQNAKMHAMLSDLSRAKPGGRVLTTDIWKCLMMHEAGFKCTFEPTVDGRGFVPLGFKSSRLTKAEFSDLIEAIYAFGAEHGVVWSDPTLARDSDGSGEAGVTRSGTTEGDSAGRASGIAQQGQAA